MKSRSHIITIPTSKTCTTRTTSDPLRVSVIEDDSTTQIFGERTVSNDVSRVITEGTMVVRAIMGGVAKMSAKRTVVLEAAVLRVPWGTLAAVGTFVFWAINT